MVRRKSVVKWHGGGGVDGGEWCGMGKGHHTIPHHTTPHHTTPHYTTPHHTTPYHTTPHHTTPYHLISGMREEVRMTIPDTVISWSMSSGFNERMLFGRAELYGRTCGAIQYNAFIYNKIQKENIR